MTEGYGATSSFATESQQPKYTAVTIARPTDPLRELSRDHSPHVTDEVFNSASHFVGAMFSLLGMVVLIVRSSVAGNAWAIVGCVLSPRFASIRARTGRRTERRLCCRGDHTDRVLSFPFLVLVRATEPSPAYLPLYRRSARRRAAR
jgi:hypothetical protein